MQNAGPQVWEVRQRVLNMIRSDRYRAAAKYRATSAWWNPERAAYHNKTGKRFAQLELIGRGIAEDKQGELAALFVAYVDYKNCLADYPHDKTPVQERECYNAKLLKFCTPERVAAGLKQ